MTDFNRMAAAAKEKTGSGWTFYFNYYAFGRIVCRHLDRL